MGSAVPQASPIGVQLDPRDDEDDEVETHQAIETLHRLIGDPPDDDPDGEADERDPDEVADVAGELQSERNAADLSGQREEVDEEGCGEVEKADPRAQTFANDVEDR